MNPAKTIRTEDLSAELIVIGGGGGGLTAAVAASEKGIKDITILEARNVPGGNAAYVGGIFAAESRLQKRLGIDARRDELFKKAMDYAHWKANPWLLRALVDKSGDTIQWLEEKGLAFDKIHPLYPNQTPMVFHFQKAPGKTGARFVKAFVKQCEDIGVRLLCKTKAKSLLTNNKGRVMGVLAESKDGEMEIYAKGVIIATGGFAGNSELLKTYLPSYDEKYFNLRGIPHRGDGLRMAAEIGADTEGMVVLEMNGPGVPTSPHLTIVANHPNTIWVNKKGKRFADESIALFPETANCLYRQPDKISFSLFDEEIKQRIFEDELKPLDALIIGKSPWPSKADEDLQSLTGKGSVKIADSWDQIAAWVEAPPEVLKAAIDEYNTFCAQGHDGLFVKDPRHLFPLRTPPYYAIQCGLNLMTTHGGIKVNHRMEVLDKQDISIPGLYAAGVETGGTDSDTYDSHLTGHSFGFTVNSGRIAGEEAAQFILEA